MSESFAVRAPMLPAHLAPGVLSDLVSVGKLENVHVDGEVLRNMETRSAGIECVLATGAEISSCRLRKASVGDVIFRDCLLFGTDFDGSGWARVEIDKGMASGMVVTDCSLQDVVFNGVKLNMANFRTSKLRKAIFRDCDLTEADFQGADMTDVRFQNCVLAKAEFSHCKLVRVDMRGSDVSTIRGASSLRGARISTAQLVSIAGGLAAELGLRVED